MNVTRTCMTCKAVIPSHAYQRHVEHECPSYGDQSIYDSEGNTINTENHGISPTSAEAELQIEAQIDPDQDKNNLNFTPDLQEKLRQIELRNPELNIRERVNRLKGNDKIRAQEVLDESYLGQQDGAEDGKLGQIRNAGTANEKQYAKL